MFCHIPYVTSFTFCHIYPPVVSHSRHALQHSIHISTLSTNDFSKFHPCWYFLYIPHICFTTSHAYFTTFPLVLYNIPYLFYHIPHMFYIPHVLHHIPHIFYHIPYILYHIFTYFTTFQAYTMMAKCKATWGADKAIDLLPAGYSVGDIAGLEASDKTADQIEDFCEAQHFLTDEKVKWMKKNLNIS